jgi:hypothetical protein
LLESTVAYANIEGIKRAPFGFREWALEQGAVDGTTDLREIPLDTSHSHLFRRL